MGMGAGVPGEAVLVLVGVDWAKTAAQKGMVKDGLTMKIGVGSLEGVNPGEMKMGMLKG